MVLAWIKAFCSLLALVVTVPTVSALVHDSNMNKHYQDKKISKKDLKPGDHIYVPKGSFNSEPSESGWSECERSGNWTIIYHHGIYLGNDEVTDFGSVNQTHPVIRRLEDFLNPNDDCIYRREYVNPARTPEETVHAAREYCFSAKTLIPLGFCIHGKYSCMNNNCEHYATMMKTQKYWSGQVEKTGFWNSCTAHKRYQQCSQEGISKSPSGTSVGEKVEEVKVVAGHLAA